MCRLLNGTNFLLVNLDQIGRDSNGHNDIPNQPEVLADDFGMHNGANDVAYELGAPSEPDANGEVERDLAPTP